MPFSPTTTRMSVKKGYIVLWPSSLAKTETKMDHNKYKRKRNVPEEEQQQDGLIQNKPRSMRKTTPPPENLKRKRQAPQPATIRRTSKRKNIRVVTPNLPPTKIPKRVIEPLYLYKDDNDNDDDEGEAIIEPIDIFQVDAYYQEDEMNSDDIDAEIVRLFGSVNDGDVLLGRGGKSNHHAGNIRFLAEVGTRKLQYMNSTKQEKTNVSQFLVDWVQQQGGRFLEKHKSTGTWEEVQNLRARKKCSQALREADEN
eukprot:CAMPEP_0198293622 /NCGR_PEP_ID=MMETSP1449-20131203/18063_1 /TAXON_ID=420275 /ORGANISM="Attheya septentrionalis, Strain CCMP2084" /LENGTH=253 /DNA_ID=CAMNT_0043993269 /DNA_START=397 /DNA_END=1158 /DNA_ORIENTATION=+